MSVVPHNFADGGAMVVREKSCDFRACSLRLQITIAGLILGGERRSTTLYLTPAAAGRDALVSSRYLGQ